MSPPVDSLPQGTTGLSVPYAYNVYYKLLEYGYDVEIKDDERNGAIDMRSKISMAYEEGFNCILILGDKEASTGSITMKRCRFNENSNYNKQQSFASLDEFCKFIDNGMKYW